MKEKETTADAMPSTLAIERLLCDIAQPCIDYRTCWTCPACEARREIAQLNIYELLREVVVLRKERDVAAALTRCAEKEE